MNIVLFFFYTLSKVYTDVFTAGLEMREPENKIVFINHLENNYFRFSKQIVIIGRKSI